MMAVPRPGELLDGSIVLDGGSRRDPLAELAGRLRVRLVAGSLPPDLCGVGHYTARLAEALAELGTDVDVVRQGRGDALGSVIARQPPGAIVHLQYPTVGAGASFGPLLGSLRRRGVVLTQHEFSYAHPLRRAMAAALANVAVQVIVSNEVERRRLARRIWPIGPKRITVLPVPTNIPTGTQAEPRALGECRAGDRPFTVGYFGIVRPDQGFARFLELVEEAMASGAPARFVVIGGWHAKDAAFVAEAQQRTARWPLRWTGRLEDEAVSAALSGLDAAYLPYPDGVSERRASAAAMFGHGVPVVTTDGPSTTEELRRCVRLAAGPAEAWRLLRSAERSDWTYRLEAAQGFVANRSFARLAQQHVVLYQAARTPR